MESVWWAVLYCCSRWCLTVGGPERIACHRSNTTRIFPFCERSIATCLHTNNTKKLPPSLRNGMHKRNNTKHHHHHHQSMVRYIESVFDGTRNITCGLRRTGARARRASAVVYRRIHDWASGGILDPHASTQPAVKRISHKSSGTTGIDEPPQRMRQFSLSKLYGSFHFRLWSTLEELFGNWTSLESFR